MTSFWKFHVGISTAPYWIYRSALARVGAEGHHLNIGGKNHCGPSWRLASIPVQSLLVWGEKGPECVSGSWDLGEDRTGLWDTW